MPYEEHVECILLYDMWGNTVPHTHNAKRLCLDMCHTLKWRTRHRTLYSSNEVLGTLLEDEIPGPVVETMTANHAYWMKLTEVLLVR